MALDPESLRRRAEAPCVPREPDELPRVRRAATCEACKPAPVEPSSLDVHEISTAAPVTLDAPVGGIASKLEHQLRALEVKETELYEVRVERAVKARDHAGVARATSQLIAHLETMTPRDPARIARARLRLAEAKRMLGDLDGAHAALARIPPQHLPPELRARRDALSRSVEAGRAEARRQTMLKEGIDRDLSEIRGLMAGGPVERNQAVVLAERVVAKMRAKMPGATAAIEGAEVLLATAKAAAGYSSGRADLERLASSATTPAARDAAKLALARVMIVERDHGNAMRVLAGLAKTATSAETRSAAQRMLVRLQASFVEAVAVKAKSELAALEGLKAEKTPQSGWALLNPLTSAAALRGDLDEVSAAHDQAIAKLTTLDEGATLAASLMRRHGLTVDDLRKMSDARLGELAGVQGAKAIRAALKDSDLGVIARNEIGEAKMSWDEKPPRLYVDRGYLRTLTDQAAKWLGDQVRSARAISDTLGRDSGTFSQIVGGTSAAILDSVSAVTSSAKVAIETAHEYYSDSVRKNTMLAKAGDLGTWGAEMLASTVTMPLTLADAKANDDERAAAITGSLVTLGTMGVLGAAPEALGFLGARIESSALARTIAASRPALLAREVFESVATPAKALNARFEATAFAHGADVVKATLKKLNPEIPSPFEVPRKGELVPGERGKMLGPQHEAGASGRPATLEGAASTAEGGRGSASVKGGKTSAPERASTISNDAISTPERARTPTNDDAIRRPEPAQAAGGDELRTAEPPRSLREPAPATSEPAHEPTPFDELEDTDIRALRTRPVSAEDALPPGVAPSMTVDEAVDALFDSSWMDADEIRALEPKELRRELYAIYKRPSPKAPTITKEAYAAELDRIGDPNLRYGEWQYFHGAKGDVDTTGSVMRYYLNLQPDTSLELGTRLRAALDEIGIRYQFKQPLTVSSYGRAENTVLYVAAADRDAARAIVERFAAEAPDALAEVTPAFTRPVARGVACADEPYPGLVPVDPDEMRHSFGSSRVRIIQEAITDAPEGISRSELKQRVRAHFRRYGLDPDAPWANPS